MKGHSSTHSTQEIGWRGLGIIRKMMRAEFSLCHIRKTKESVTLPPPLCDEGEGGRPAICPTFMVLGPLLCFLMPQGRRVICRCPQLYALALKLQHESEWPGKFWAHLRVSVQRPRMVSEMIRSQFPSNHTWKTTAECKLGYGKQQNLITLINLSSNSTHLNGMSHSDTYYRPHPISVQGFLIKCEVILSEMII